MVRRLQKPGYLVPLIVGLFLWLVACRPTAVNEPMAENQPYTFYLYPWTPENDENRLIALEPETLAARPDGKSMELGQTWLLSGDGSTLVNVEYLRGRASFKPEDLEIVVYDFLTGAERGRFSPPAAGLITGLSRDGRRLLLQADAYPYTQKPYPPTVDWYLLDTNSGELLTHFKDDDNACFRQSARLDAAGQRIYCVGDPELKGKDGPQPMKIVAYDVESGRQTETLELPGVLLGGKDRELEDDLLVWEFLEPALALSPDGSLLAAVHADSEMVTLIDAASLTVKRTLSLRNDKTAWNWFGLAPAVAYAKGEMEGTIRQAAFSADGRTLYVFSQKIWVESEAAPAERGLWLIDLARERIVAEALPDYQIQWLEPAPDGTVYLFGTTDEKLWPFEIRQTSPSKLWRLDGQTLDVLAERAFTGYRGGRLAAGISSSTLTGGLSNP